jgi:plasmid stability protein
MGRTVTLSDDVAERLDKEAERTGTSAEEIVNETLRRNLKETEITPTPFVVRARNLGVRAGVNLECISRLLEETEGPDWK